MIRFALIFLAASALYGQMWPFPGPGTKAASGGGGGSFTQVQKKTFASTAGATSHSITFDTGPTQNNLLILTAACDDSISTPGGWNQAVYAIDWVGVGIYYKIAGAGESSTVSVSIGSSTGCSLVAFEYSGINTSNPLDRTSSATAQGQTVSTGTTLTTQVADELLIGAAGLSFVGGSISFSSWSNSFVEEADVQHTGTSTHNTLGVAARIVTATSTYSTAGTASSSAGSNNVGVIATFRKAP